MKQPLFRGDGTRTDTHTQLPRSRRMNYLRPEFYRPDQGLIDAVNVALLLGQPLLLTGEPGTGKTQLAYYLAWELGLDNVLKFETKSNSTSGSLFYTYDALRRFQHASSGITHDTALPYITYNALGKAILFTHEPTSVARYLPSGYAHPGRSRSIVLIDEVDKAPRDFPNDILNELDQLYFRVSELDNEPISADPDLRPIVILTSNSEKDLPDAFLRRCIFYHIPFPTQDQMSRIVSDRLGLHTGGSSALLTDALELFYLLRQPGSGLRKKPATAELLDWVGVLVDSSAPGDAENPLVRDPELALRTISSLVKTVEDQEKATRITREWLDRRR
jgi:MoxR-like ATPase